MNEETEVARVSSLPTTHKRESRGKAGLPDPGRFWEGAGITQGRAGRDLGSERDIVKDVVKAYLF